MTYRELAVKLRRTPGTVEVRAHSLGLIKQPLWKNEEVRKLKKEFQKGVAVREIAELLGKSIKSIDIKITRLGLR